MIGAIAGDIIGSYYERNSTKEYDFDLFKGEIFTDDTVLTMAIANALLTNTSYKDNIVDFGNRYNEVGYGSSFRDWLTGSSDFKPYNSWGNGSAMRVSPIAYAFETVGEVLSEAKKSAECTHNHPEGIKGAQAIAMAIFLARKGCSKLEIKAMVEKEFNYDLDRRVFDIRPTYTFDVSCQGSVPESIICFLESEDYEDCIRLAISLGGDADTMAAMAGGIAEEFYKEIPENIQERVVEVLPDEFSEIILKFKQKYK